MANNCEDELAADIERNCDANPIAGLESDIVIFNKKDIDPASIVYDAANDLLVTTFSLFSGKVGYKLEGVKQSNFVGDELVIKDYSNSYSHLLGGVIVNPSVANRKTLSILMGGDEFVAIVNKKWKGTDSLDAFAIFGLDSGLVGSTKTYKSNESDGVEVFELKSREGYEEPKTYLTYSTGVYATDLAEFDAKFIEA
jgi:hypothetical protein